MATRVCVFVNLKPVKQTEAAVMFRAEKKDIWIPKSHIFAKREKGFWVTKWLMEQKKVKLPSVPPKEMRKENIDFYFLPQSEPKQTSDETAKDEKDQGENEDLEEEVTYHYPDEIETTVIQYDSDLFRSEPKCEVLNEFRVMPEEYSHYCIIRKKATDKCVIDIHLHERDEQLPLGEQMKETVLSWLELSAYLQTYQKSNERTFCIYPDLDIEITIFELVKREKPTGNKTIFEDNPFFKAVKTSMEKEQQMQQYHNEMNGTWDLFPKPNDAHVEHWLVDEFKLEDARYLVDYCAKKSGKNTMESLMIDKQGEILRKRLVSFMERKLIFDGNRLESIGEPYTCSDEQTQIHIYKIGEKRKYNESLKIR